MTDTIAGGLIQMNAHMMVAKSAKLDMSIGLIGFIIFVAITIMMIKSHKSKMWTIMFVIFAIAYAVLFVHGVITPNEKIIHACASGPVSLEQVAAVYDIIEVDGKELILKVR